MKDYSSIVVSSEVTLRRNLSGFDFPSTINDKDGVKVLNKVADTILALNSGYKIYKIKTLTEMDRRVMFEKNLISNRLLECEDYGAVILSDNEELSIMINESDHIVESMKKDGLNLIAVYDAINEIDNQILSKLDIAYDDEFGFLTSNIGQVGTGLEARVNLFLPALMLTGKIKSVQAEINSHGFDLQLSGDEFLPENPYSFKMTNTQTIGRRESEYIIKITEATIRVCEMEIRARSEILSQTYVNELIDKVYRSWGILTNCYKISDGESQKLLSELKMGAILDIVRFKEAKVIDNLFIDVKPYSLTKISGSKVSVADLEKYRANFLANILKTKRVK